LKLSHSDAMRGVNTVAGELTRRQKAAVVAVTDDHGELIALLRVGDAPLSSISIAMNKAWTAARERQTSAAIGQASKDRHSGFDIGYYGDSRYVGWGGGVPVWRNGQVIGALGVSGLEEAEDVELAELGVGAVTSAE
jgi:glc operon protein GlcG